MEPRAYFDPPSEREWTIAESEEFFAGQDAITGLSNGDSPAAFDILKTIGRYGYGAYKFSDLLVGDQFYRGWAGTCLFTKVADKQAQYKDFPPQYYDEYMTCRLVPEDKRGEDNR